MSPVHASKEIRREQILQAAIACFSRKGYRLTTMDDIAAESGLSKGSLYWHYENKKDLLLSIMTWYFGQMEQEFEQTIFTAPTATEKLQLLADVITQTFTIAQMEPLVNVLIDFYAEARHDAEMEAALADVLNPYIDFITGIVEEGISGGEFKPVKPRQVAIVLMAAFDGMFLYQMMFPDDFDWPQTSRLFAGTFLNGLRDKK